MGIDAGGTMTDTILVDENGSFSVGKAATTPQNESLGFIESADDAAGHWNLTNREVFPQLAVILYSGTGMLNTLLTRTGRQVGLIVTRGMEDAVLMGRGLQAWAGYSYSDRLHAVTHNHPEPLVPRRRIRGVTERIDQFGQEVIPVYEHEAMMATKMLLAQQVESICICCLFSYINPAHEQQIARIVKQVLEQREADIPILLSSEVRPVIREQSRLNSLLIEAFAASKGRYQLMEIQESAAGHGFRNDVQTVLSYGGLANIRYPRLHETMISGPVGGVLGAKYVGDIIGSESIVVTDMGGTSFDMGVVTRGHVPIDNEPTLDRFKLNLPTIALDTIGAGAGTIIKVDPLTKKISLGPESAGSMPGPVAFDQGGTAPTVCDCDVVLGRLNPNYFLGGKVKLNADKSRRVLQERVADVLGVDVYECAEGICTMLEVEARDAILRLVSARGVDPSEYCLMVYGGSGPLHMAGYSHNLGFKDILTFPWAAAFSAFGCTTVDYAHRYARSVQLDVPPEASADRRGDLGRSINETWEQLERTATAEMVAEGHDRARVAFQPFAMIRYTGQLEDVDVISPVRRMREGCDLTRLLDAFDDLYERINKRVSRYGEAGHTITELGLTARVEKVKPKLVRRPLASRRPNPEAFKGTRSMYCSGRWHEAGLWEMDLLEPGNRVAGPAIVEHPATTLVIPPGDRVWVDEWTIIHYEHAKPAVKKRATRH